MIRLIAFFLVSFMSTAMADNISVTVQGISSKKGHIRCLIFAKKAGYPDQAAKSVAKAEILTKDSKGTQHTFHFSHLTEGTYAVSVIHDIDSSGSLNKNFLGMPKEPVALSGWNGTSKPNFSKNRVALTKASPLILKLKHF